MRVHILLFLFIIVATCQASRQAPYSQQVLREGLKDDPLYAKFREMSDKYLIETAEEPDPETLLDPDAYKPGYLRAYLDPTSRYAALNSQTHYPTLHTRGNLMSESVQLRQQAQANQGAQLLRLAEIERESAFSEIDREALSKVSEADRQVLVSQLSQADREVLLTKLEDGKIEDIIPIGENRFGFMNGGFSDAAAKIGAGAGEFIGRKLAGALGARLGAAVGAYLGAAAASRFTGGKSGDSRGTNNRDLQYGTYGTRDGAVVVKNK